GVPRGYSGLAMVYLPGNGENNSALPHPRQRIRLVKVAEGPEGIGRTLPLALGRAAGLAALAVAAGLADLVAGMAGAGARAVIGLRIAGRLRILTVADAVVPLGTALLGVILAALLAERRAGLAALAALVMRLAGLLLAFADRAAGLTARLARVLL